MSGAQRVSANAVQALKGALKAAFWFKGDLRSYLSVAVSDRSLLARVSWEGYKWAIIDEVVDPMVQQPEKYQEELIQLMVDVSSMREFPKLARHEDSARLIKEAHEAVGSLRGVGWSSPTRRSS